jgi:hypothetical protein
MKRVVLDSPMAWAIIGLIASTVAEITGPDLVGIYLTALGVAAIALAFIFFPRLRGSGPAGQGRSERQEGSAH